jgi:uncharacterized protein
VRVKVLEVDIPRKRIGLTLRLDDEVGKPQQPAERGGGGRRDNNRQGNRGGGQQRPRRNEPAATGSMAEALRKAGFGK